jgi:hypothetical protein
LIAQRSCRARGRGWNKWPARAGAAAASALVLRLPTRFMRCAAQWPPRHDRPRPGGHRTGPHQAPTCPRRTTPSPVRRVHAGIRRTIGTAQVDKGPAVMADLKNMLEQLPGPRVGLRDRPAAARDRRRLQALRARVTPRRRSRVLVRRADRHPEKIEDGSAGRQPAHRHPPSARRGDVSCPGRVSQARDGQAC